ncbi:hypothetical protein DRW03_05085 [Corallococcus sp. H22C18031201]|uniref:hypothetical protein n=1 Tax=Citreicoccus inhibens TaxID=2849499 RepID=UPI000E7503FE|nr:hypothetical protein [Citreicoccus inhibens]MBU8895970.1 hypothetical protein [Citreicoccus inhibens]RJS25850.1 hypothetical protein DRW03_05085 [Corallococcus sp. H22C18031201]
MKRVFFAAAVLALGLGACVDSPTEIQVFDAKQLDVECKVTATDPSILNGSVNLNYAVSYIAAFMVNSSLNQGPVVIGSLPVDGTSDPDAVYIDRMSVTYKATLLDSSVGGSSGTNLSMDPEEVPVRLAVRGATKDNIVVLDLVTVAAYNKLKAAVTAGQYAQVLVTFKFKGKTAGGAKAESNEVTFPLSVSNTPIKIPTCASGVIFKAVGPCGTFGGQDGVYPECVNP